MTAIRCFVHPDRSGLSVQCILCVSFTPSLQGEPVPTLFLDLQHPFLYGRRQLKERWARRVQNISLLLGSQSECGICRNLIGCRAPDERIRRANCEARGVSILSHGQQVRLLLAQWSLWRQNDDEFWLTLIWKIYWVELNVRCLEVHPSFFFFFF